MTLRELCALISEITEVAIYDAEVDQDSILAIYDGRNSIPTEYNECIVTELFPYEHKMLKVWLDHETVLKAQKYRKANERDRWLFGTDYDPGLYSGGTRYFELTADALREAVEKGYIDENERQNYGPTVREFLDFVSWSQINWSFEGYAVSPERHDYRMTVDAIFMEGECLSIEEICAFAEAFRSADEFTLAPFEARAWWD